MKKIFMFILSFTLIFSGLSITTLKSVSADIVLSGTYYISAKHSGKVLTVANGNSGTTVTQQDKRDSDYQKWIVTEVSNEIYQITNQASGLVLDVAQGVTTDGAKVIQYQNVGSTNQQWQFVGHADGSYEITSVRSGKSLDIKGASQENGANLIQWTNNAAVNQKFVLENIESPLPTIYPELSSPESYIQYLKNYSGNSLEQVDYAKDTLEKFINLSAEEQKKYLSILSDPNALSAMFSGNFNNLGENQKYVNKIEQTSIVDEPILSPSFRSASGTRTVTHTGKLEAFGISWTGYKIAGRYTYNSRGATNALSVQAVVTHHFNPAIDTDLSDSDKYISNNRFYAESVFSYKIGLIEVGGIKIGNVYLNVGGDQTGKTYGQFYTQMFN